MTSLAPHTMPTPLSKCIQLARPTTRRAASTRGITMRYEPAIRATCDVPGAALQSGPPQKRNAMVAVVTIAAMTEPLRPEPSRPNRRIRRLEGRELPAGDGGGDRDTRDQWGDSRFVSRAP